VEADRKKLAGLKRDLEGEQAELEADEDTALLAARKVIDFLLSGVKSVTPPVTEPGTTRPCACGCGQPVTSPRPEAKYATGACRVRVHRRNG
jgi:hypothetical protein